jgi:hypothetical protein
VQDLFIYGNVLINDKLKLEAFKATLPGWLDYWKAPCFIRVRGQLAEEVSLFCEDFPNVTCIQGSRFIQWRKQTWCDVKNLEANFIVFYLEDHLISDEPPNSAAILSEIRSKNVTVFQYSWFRQYEKMRLFLESLGGSEEKCGSYIELTKENLEEILVVDYRWFVSLTSLFEKSFLLRLLESPRPFLRKKDPKSPHDVEQKPSSTWYLPITFGLSKEEIAVSLDDDNTIPGSSAISRGIYKNARSLRGENHDTKFSTISIFWTFKYKLFGRNSLRFIPHKIKIILTHVIYWPSYFGYSLQAPLFRSLDWLRYKSLNRLINASPKPKKAEFK